MPSAKKATVKNKPAAKTKPAAKKRSAAQTSREVRAAKPLRDGERESMSMPKAGKDLNGGLTAKGRAYFARKQGSHLRPGVTGPADTPEKMRRKGSFLSRTFTHPRGPMLDEAGESTRLALSAHAWGEPVPKTEAAAKKLAAKGRALLEQYHATQAEGGSSPSPDQGKALRKSAGAIRPKTGM